MYCSAKRYWTTRCTWYCPCAATILQQYVGNHNDSSLCVICYDFVLRRCHPPVYWWLRLHRTGWRFCSKAEKATERFQCQAWLTERCGVHVEQSSGHGHENSNISTTKLQILQITFYFFMQAYQSSPQLQCAPQWLYFMGKFEGDPSIWFKMRCPLAIFNSLNNLHNTVLLTCDIHVCTVCRM